jgi:hypothetical protein
MVFVCTACAWHAQASAAAAAMAATTALLVLLLKALPLSFILVLSPALLLPLLLLPQVLPCAALPSTGKLVVLSMPLSSSALVAA